MDDLSFTNVNVIQDFVGLEGRRNATTGQVRTDFTSIVRIERAVPLGSRSRTDCGHPQASMLIHKGSSRAEAGKVPLTSRMTTNTTASGKRRMPHPFKAS